MDGLVDKIDVFQYNLVEDEGGGLRLGDEYILYEDVNCRVTVFKADWQQQDKGIESKEQWHVILDVLLDLPKSGDVYIRLSYSAPVSVIDKGVHYRIVKSRVQRDEYGVFHHSSLVVEKDERSTP